MNDHSPHMTRKTIYGLPVILAVVIGGLLYVMGNSPDLIFMKLTVVPLYLLAGRAIDILLPLAKDAAPSLKLLERLSLDAVLLACCLTVFNWSPGKGAVEMAVTFMVLVLVYTGAMFLLRLVSFRRNAPHRS